MVFTDQSKAGTENPLKKFGYILTVIRKITVFDVLHSRYGVTRFIHEFLWTPKLGLFKQWT